VEFVLVEEVVEGLDGFIGFVDGFVGEGVEAGDGGADADGLGEEFGDIGIFVDVQGGVAVLPDLVRSGRP